jgi:hypothetical protein
MDDKKDFEVTEKAGTFVAGRRSPGAGKTIKLTEAEAHHALMMGELRLASTKAKASGKPGSNPPAGGDV